jgi:hypothetical protein
VEAKEGGDDGSSGANIEGELEIGLGRAVSKAEMRGNRAFHMHTKRFQWTRLTVWRVLGVKVGS